MSDEVLPKGAEWVPAASIVPGNTLWVWTKLLPERYAVVVQDVSFGKSTNPNVNVVMTFHFSEIESRQFYADDELIVSRIAKQLIPPEPPTQPTGKLNLDDHNDGFGSIGWATRDEDHY